MSSEWAWQFCSLGRKAVPIQDEQVKLVNAIASEEHQLNKSQVSQFFMSCVRRMRDSNPNPTGLSAELPPPTPVGTLQRAADQVARECARRGVRSQAEQHGQDAAGAGRLRGAGDDSMDEDEERVALPQLCRFVHLVHVAEGEVRAMAHERTLLDLESTENVQDDDGLLVLECGGESADEDEEDGSESADECSDADACSEGQSDD